MDKLSNNLLKEAKEEHSLILNFQTNTLFIDLRLNFSPY
jgi:hypothetical protein